MKFQLLNCFFCLKTLSLCSMSWHSFTMQEFNEFQVMPRFIISWLFFAKNDICLAFFYQIVPYCILWLKNTQCLHFSNLGIIDTLPWEIHNSYTLVFLAIDIVYQEVYMGQTPEMITTSSHQYPPLLIKSPDNITIVTHL